METVRGMVVDRCVLTEGYDVGSYEMFQGLKESGKLRHGSGGQTSAVGKLMNWRFIKRIWKGRIWSEYLSGDRREKLGEGHALYGFQGKRGACFLCDI